MLTTPPPWAQRTESRDLDEFRRSFSRYGSHERECQGRGALLMRWDAVFLGSAYLGWHFSSLGQRVKAATGFRILHLALQRPISYRVGARHFEALPGRAVWLAPDTEYQVSYAADSPALAIKVDEDVLEQALQTFGVDPAQVRAGAREVPLGREALAALGRTLRSLQSAAPPPSGPPSDRLGPCLASWIAAAVAPRLGTTRASAAANARLGHLEEWIDAHLAEPLGLAQLSRVSGLEARGLHKCFVQRRGVSPMRWIASRRMAAARMRLLAATPGDSVIRIAADLGLTHAGRFAVNYGRRYGESPSTTLACSLGRC